MLQATSYTVRRSKKAKRILLKVGVDGRVELVVPRWASLRAAHIFFASKQDWLQRILQSKKLSFSKPPLRSGDVVQFFGTVLVCDFAIRPGKVSIVSKDGVLTVSASREQLAVRAVETWYKQNSKRMFYELLAELGTEDVTVRVSGAKTRWGSCNRRRRSLMFNWRLALAPVGVAKYVVAHEVAHLTHPDHSKRFWAAVKDLFPGYEEQRMWLKDNGQFLQL